MTIETTTRNADLSGLVDLLKTQQDVKYDVVAPASALEYQNGLLVVKDGSAVMDSEGVSLTDAFLSPTEIFEEGVSQRLGIPRGYVARMRNEHTELLDANVNGWLQQEPNRKFLVRGFKSDDPSETGIARALLSDRFKVIDNVDILFAALDGIRFSGANVEIAGADLSERRMTVKVSAPEIAALAPELLGNYRSPFTGQSGSDVPVVFAGLVISNSETGGGAFTITPRIVFQVCSNGLTVKKDAMRQIHIGGKMDEGVIKWSDETQQRTLELVKAKTADAVRTFLDVDYVRMVIAGIEEAAAVKVTSPVKAVDNIAKGFGFNDSEKDQIMTFFIQSGDATAGGVMNAVTATAQVLTDPDRANELEDVALDVLTATAQFAAKV
jgi:hypothetical protein